MQHKQRFKELLEKIKAHAQKNNDPELLKLAEEFETQSQGEEYTPEEGGNNPEPPDVP